MALPIVVKPFPGVQAPPTILGQGQGPLSKWLRSMWETLSMMRLGKLSCVFYAELDGSGTTTVITNPYLTKQSVVVINPVNAAAASIWTSIYADEANRDIGQWTLTHANTTGLGTTAFLFAIIG